MVGLFAIQPHADKPLSDRKELLKEIDPLLVCFLCRQLSSGGFSL
jgi:hypothetical protein